jgi:GNAT superfamily N-acetyltransferase
MSPLTIREATPQDIPAILSLYREAQIDDSQIDETSAFTPEEAVAHLASLARYPYYRVFVALIGQTIVGTYELIILDNMAKRGLKSAIVEDVAVSPAYQGQGIGRAMMHHALEQCRQAACYKLTLSSNLKRTSAHRFYDSLGFTRHGYSFQTHLP